MAGHYFGKSQWELPPKSQFLRLVAVAQNQGAPRTRPYFVLPDQPDASSTYAVLEAAVEEIRTAYEIRRVPFHPAMNTTDCWSHPKVLGPERLRDPNKKLLHPCQKPLLFARRMIEASTRPGDLVFEPFGGTCRVAFACEELGDRRYVCSEMNPEYVNAVVPLLPKEIHLAGKQRVLFAGG